MRALCCTPFLKRAGWLWRRPRGKHGEDGIFWAGDGRYEAWGVWGHRALSGEGGVGEGEEATMPGWPVKYTVCVLESRARGQGYLALWGPIALRCEMEARFVGRPNTQTDGRLSVQLQVSTANRPWL